MSPCRTLPITFLLSLLLLAGSVITLNSRYNSPYPAIGTSLANNQTGLRDVGGVVLGIRRITADLAWIQTLQYYGTEETGQTEFEAENGLGRYPEFLSHCRHVAQIDPFFTYVYYYGGAVLGWNLGRLDEAEALLKEGIARNPSEWRLPLYLAALAYQKNHNVKDLTRFLEVLVQDPQCPLMMKALLANIYKKQHDFDKALTLWNVIYASGDPSYQHRAIEQVKEIGRLRRAP